MNNTTQSSFEQEDSLTSTGLKGASLLLFILVGAFTNGRVIYNVLVVDVIRPVLNRFIASLSFADLASCLIVMPFAFVSLVSGEWLFGHIFCAIHATLSQYFAQVTCLSVGAMVYERYQAIYRKRFPSLSSKQTTILLCFAWIFPIPLSASMLRHQFAYIEYAGMCSLVTDHWNAVNIATEIAFGALSIFLVVFMFWRILSLVLPIRRRVSPGLLSNEEKLAMAAHVQSAWTLMVFVFIYVILVTPIFIVNIVNNQSLLPGKTVIGDDVVCAFLWLYWLQCAIKPFIYVLRSDRCTNCLCCRCCGPGKENENTTSCFRRRRSRVYKVSGDILENTLPSSGGVPVFPRQGDAFFDNFRISIELVPVTNRARRVPEQGRTADEGTGQPIQDQHDCIENISRHSVFIVDLESHISEDEEELNSSKEAPGSNETGAIPADVCQGAVELEVIERMLDEALKAQQREWTINT